MRHDPEGQPNIQTLNYSACHLFGMYFFEETWIVVLAPGEEKDEIIRFLEALNLHWEQCANPDYIRIRRP